MKVNLSTPTALYKANQELTLHLGQLMQHSQARWAEFLQAQARAAMTPFAVTSKVQPMTALMSGEWPADAFWTSLQGSTQQWQATMEAALENQTAFTDELREAISTWQQECSDALQGASGSMPLSASLKSMMEMFAPKSDAPAEKGPAPKKRPATGKASRK